MCVDYRRLPLSSAKNSSQIVELLLVGCQGAEVICEPCSRPDTDVRNQHPEKLHELIEAFDQAAWLNLVYLLDRGGVQHSSLSV